MCSITVPDWREADQYQLSTSRNVVCRVDDGESSLLSHCDVTADLCQPADDKFDISAGSCVLSDDDYDVSSDSDQLAHNDCITPAPYQVAKIAKQPVRCRCRLVPACRQ